VPARPLVVVAMSGGVDSSVAAVLARENGARVEGASLRLWDSARRDDRVCSDWRDAKRVADALDIPHTLIDQRAAFEHAVVDPFVREYASGRTPNPCVACNSDFKLGVLLDWALARGADFVATGHYARLERRGGSSILRRARDLSRDQSYFLFGLTEAQLARSLFPLGEWTKTEVRARAADLGLPVAAKRDSQDLCFGDPAALVRARGRGGAAGAVVDETGGVLGRHEGVEGFTIGQRRGLCVAASAPLYVRSIDAAAARVVVGPSPPRSDVVFCREWNWLGSPAEEGELLAAQTRYRQAPLPARVRSESPGRVRLELERPAVAVALGQAAVVYRGDEVVGGGWIDEIARADGAA
jgi:tRNA-specific 2-thiouridylase